MEEWIIWKPIPNLASKYYVKSLSDRYSGFKILLEDAQNANQLQIIFKDGIDSFSRTDETFRFRTVIKLKEKYGADFYKNWTFFKIINSSYLQWLSLESYEESDARLLSHYCIVASDSIVDIINNKDPIISWKKQVKY